MPYEPLLVIPDGMDVNEKLLQQLNDNINISYDFLTQSGRGLVHHKKITSSIGVTSKKTSKPTTIVSTTCDLVPGRLYRVNVLLGPCLVVLDYTLSSKQYVALFINGTRVRYKYFLTPRSPSLKTFFIPTKESQSISCKGLLIGTDYDAWTMVGTYLCDIYVEDFGDPKGIAI
jgi:hypothetical protein